MLTEDGRVVVSSDVTFPTNAMEPVTGPVSYADNEAWLAPFAAPDDCNTVPASTGTSGQLGARAPENADPTTTRAPPPGGTRRAPVDAARQLLNLHRLRA